MIIKLKRPARVALAEGVYELSDSEARRLLALGAAEIVKEEPVSTLQLNSAKKEPAKKRGRKKKD